MSASTLWLIKVSSWPLVANSSFTPYCFEGCVIGLSWCALRRMVRRCFFLSIIQWFCVVRKIHEVSCGRGRRCRDSGALILARAIERFYNLLFPLSWVSCLWTENLWGRGSVIHHFDGILLEFFSIPVSPSIFYFLHYKATKISPSYQCVCLYTTKAHISGLHLHSA